MKKFKFFTYRKGLTPGHEFFISFKISQLIQSIQQNDREIKKKNIKDFNIVSWSPFCKRMVRDRAKLKI